MFLTTRQHRFLETLTAKLREIDDPDPDIITNEGYRYSLTYLKRYKCKLPKITFTPYGHDTKIKAKIMWNAKLGIDESLDQKLQKIRQKQGLKAGQDKEERILARRFKWYWDQYWYPIAKALTILQDPQQRFTKPDQTVAEPIRLLMGDKIPINKPETPEKPESETEKPYNEVLAELE
ncbi:hypothetical protein ACFL0O_00320 [Thermodesulfobacteriota bacterium]